MTNRSAIRPHALQTLKSKHPKRGECESLDLQPSLIGHSLEMCQTVKDLINQRGYLVSYCIGVCCVTAGLQVVCPPRAAYRLPHLDRNVCRLYGGTLLHLSDPEDRRCGPIRPCQSSIRHGKSVPYVEFVAHAQGTRGNRASSKLSSGASCARVRPSSAAPRWPSKTRWRAYRSLYTNY